MSLLIFECFSCVCTQVCISEIEYLSKSLVFIVLCFRPLHLLKRDFYIYWTAFITVFIHVPPDYRVFFPCLYPCLYFHDRVFVKVSEKVAWLRSSHRSGSCFDVALTYRLLFCREGSWCYGVFAPDVWQKTWRIHTKSKPSTSLLMVGVKKGKAFKTKNIDLGSKENKGEAVLTKGREKERDWGRLWQKEWKGEAGEVCSHKL